MSVPGEAGHRGFESIKAGGDMIRIKCNGCTLGILGK